MPNDTVIKVENLGKQYRIGSREAGYRTFRETLVDAAKAPFLLFKDLGKKIIRPRPHAQSPEPSPDGETIWALKDVSFEVKRGEVVGIIGRNGAGKSTLLKVLSKITEPTDGRVELRGRVGSLLEVGTGFHPELTGHENIYLYGAILGMDRWEITRKFDEIVAFAELEKFVDTPVKRYSSGMYMRLAFAVAAHLEPEILLIDEVLAVGDLEFQKKCLGKMEDVAQMEGRTILFVSHNMAAIKSLCPRTLLIESGKISLDDESSICIDKYVDRSLFYLKTNDLSYFRRDKIKSSTPVFFTKIKVLNNNVNETALPIFASGDDITIQMDLEVVQSIRDATITLVLSRTTGEKVVTIHSEDKDISINLKPPRTTYICRLNKIPLSPGTYQVDFGINQTTITRAYDVILNYPLFIISGVPQTSGKFPHRNWGAFFWEDITWSNDDM